MPSKPRKIGSVWHRWDPHIHCPGTLLNDQFKGDWNGYLAAIEAATPTVVALGVTDYYTLKGYKAVLAQKSAGRLPGVEFIFPNVELRLPIQTEGGQGVNVHILVDPKDPEHVAKIEGFLARITFENNGKVYPCSDAGLVELGRDHLRNPALPEEAALQAGANQFKINRDDITKEFSKDHWLGKNCLLAISAGADGIGGFSKDTSFAAIREELGRFAQIIFSGSPAVRDFWLGRHKNFEALGFNHKPCLHGSDAHKLGGVVNPAESRYCWIKSDVNFEGLRQAVVEPERRVYIGDQAPEGPGASQVVSKITIKDSPWLQTDEIEFNSGLVTIIGAKGSGKTALADLLAVGVQSAEDDPGKASFLNKAREYLNGTKVEVDWENGDKTVGVPFESPQEGSVPRVRYLSQQFVESLCDPSGELASTLINEIERVVYESMPEEQRAGCGSFDELRDLLLQGPRAQCTSDREIITALTAKLAEDSRLIRQTPAIQQLLLDTQKIRAGLEKDIAAIPVLGGPAAVQNTNALAAVNMELSQLQTAIATEDRRERSLNDIRAEMRRQDEAAERQLEELKVRYAGVIGEQNWQFFRLLPQEESTALLDREVASCKANTLKLTQFGLPKPTGSPAGLNLSALKLEKERLTKALGLDQINAKKRQDLEKSLGETKKAEDSYLKSLEHAKKAPERRTVADADRLKRYEGVFKSMLEEETVLNDLYKGLLKDIDEDPRLKKLSISVRRKVDLKKWVDRGNDLLDLRKTPFGPKDGLETVALAELLPAWAHGTAAEIATAVDAFIDKNAEAAIKAMIDSTNLVPLGEWIFSSDHIAIEYGIQHDGVDIAKLSPGSRGIVLLTLYLALDKWDMRPLIIDQPEENLDPQSVFDDLVPFFKDAARRRQIFMVTHNANLVVNTDSDQVLVAEATRESPNALPNISYWGGGLDDSDVQVAVCNLLGGQTAFRRREMRYRFGKDKLS